MKAKPPKTTSAQRMKKLRADNKDKGLIEVRGLFAPPAHHNQIKAYARGIDRLKKKSATKRDPLLD